MKRVTSLAVLAALIHGTALVSAPSAWAAGSPGDLVLNEFSAVGDDKFTTSADPVFGLVAGNGGNWVELVVMTDHLDIRGWELQWSNADPDQGAITFSGDPLWADLRAGTIVTLREADANFGTLPTDVSFAPDAEDWWIHVDIDSTQYVEQNGFKVDNDDWQARIVDETATTIQDWIGESVPLWTGGGINSSEVGRLEQDPTREVGFADVSFQDATSSTFGAPNQYSGGAGVQSFAELRSWFQPAASAPALPWTGLLTLTVALGSVGIGLLRRRRDC